MYPHSFFWHYLWIAPQVLLIAVASLMVKRRLHREFPSFFTYAVFQIILNAVLFFLDHDASVTGYQYRWAEWIGEIFSIALRFAVIHEIVSVIFRSYPALKNLGIIAFRGAMAILGLIAVAVAVHNPGVGYFPYLFAGMTLLDRAIAIVQCGILVFLFLFSSYFKLSWRSYVFGIATGLGIFSATQLATAAVKAYLGPYPKDYLGDFVVMGMYHCSVLLWLFYFLLPEPVSPTIRLAPVHDLESWNDELRRLLQR